MENDQDLLKTYITNYFAGGAPGQADALNSEDPEVIRRYVCGAKYSTYDSFMGCLGQAVVDSKSLLLWKVFEKV